MLYRNKEDVPSDFVFGRQVAGVFVISHDRRRFLMLKRQTGKLHAGCWGAPGGKVNTNPQEAVSNAASRECFEETGEPHCPMKYLAPVFVRYLGEENTGGEAIDFEYHVFAAARRAGSSEEIRLSKSEHVAFRWVTMEESLKLVLVPEMGGVIKLFVPSLLS